MKCPVCDNVNTAMVCPECGFDSSKDYGEYPTLGPVREGASVAVLRKDYLSNKTVTYSFLIKRASLVLCLFSLETLIVAFYFKPRAAILFWLPVIVTSLLLLLYAFFVTTSKKNDCTSKKNDLWKKYFLSIFLGACIITDVARIICWLQDFSFRNFSFPFLGITLMWARVSIGAISFVYADLCGGKRTLLENAAIVIACVIGCAVLYGCFILGVVGCYIIFLLLRSIIAILRSVFAYLSGFF